MTREGFNEKFNSAKDKIRDVYSDCGEKIRTVCGECADKAKQVPSYFEKSNGAVTEFFKDKKTKFYLACTLFVESITFIVIFFSLWNKKKGMSGLFGALAAASAAAGSLLLISSLDEDENGKKTLIHFDGCYDDADEFDDDISVEIVDDEDIAPAEEDK